MKKVLMIILLIIPILIFSIVFFTSGIISFIAPLSVKEIKIIENSEIKLSEPTKEIKYIRYQILPIKSENKEISYYNTDNEVVEVNDCVMDDKTGIGECSLKIKQYGFSEITLKTEDGGYEAKADIEVLDPNLNDKEVQSIVFEYKNDIHNYKFGYDNNLEMEYKVYPKTALNSKDLIFYLDDKQIDNDYQNKLVKIEFKKEKKIQKLKVIINNKEYYYNFDVDKGINIKNNTEEEFRNLVNNNTIYLLQEVILTKKIIINNSIIYGNNFRIDHTNLEEYNDDTKNIGMYALEIQGESKLNDLHILGKLDINQQPYQNIINVGYTSKNNSGRIMEMNNCIIQNGRFNLTLIGKYNQDLKESTIFNITNTKFIGSYFSSIEIDNSLEGAYDINSTKANLENIDISYTAVGILIQNSYSGQDFSKGYSLVNVKNVNSTSWRNLDDANGILGEYSFSYLLKEFKMNKEYDDVVYKSENKLDYYVNPLIMLRGGTTNYSILNINDEELNIKLVKKERTPKGYLEKQVLGGGYKFVIYLYHKDNYKEV